ncbi:hypothetical protein M899_1600 [Bacteriovorax sp. BSW11_IV]|uniref:hypothetical protein n=1 Tax=Bacteriovorax sp. BSW11_IV TaxID=1353529 RepID=UPI00038A0C76|nr:hypothetical protein [Bacteriovorax sp. BSW11_IV]EQC49363.1 hypothetical protein M899_1600 [Bacteriovorax sp. BSW11_IV]
METKIAKVLITILFFNLSAFAGDKDDKFLCTMFKAYEYKDIVVNMPGIDKTKHCSFSCIIALDCGVVESYIAGVAKEIYDIFTPGTPDIKDIEANVHGIKLAAKKIATSEEQCMNICHENYGLVND